MAVAAASWAERHCAAPLALSERNAVQQRDEPVALVLRLAGVHSLRIDPSLAAHADRYDLRLSVSFFDDVNKQLFGRTWLSPGVPLPEADHQGFHLDAGEEAWFHTRVADPDCYVLVELVAELRESAEDASAAGEDNASHSAAALPGPRVALGWTVLQAFPADVTSLPAYTAQQVASAAAEYRGSSSDDGTAGAAVERRLYPGTPRCVFLAPNMADALQEADKSPASLVGSVSLALFRHPALTHAITRLVPENVLVGRETRVPGLPPSADARGPLWLVTLQPPATAAYFLGSVRLAFDPPLREWEDLLRGHLNTNAQQQYGAAAGAVAPARIVQRLLRLGVHNGLTWVVEPTEVLLAEREGSKGVPASLVFDGSLTLADVPADPDVAVVLELVYVVAFPVVLGNDTSKKGRELRRQVSRRQSMSVLPAETTERVHLLWGALLPFGNTAAPYDTHNVALLGSRQSTANPTHALLYSALAAAADGHVRLTHRLCSATASLTFTTDSVGALLQDKGRQLSETGGQSLRNARSVMGTPVPLSRTLSQRAPPSRRPPTATPGARRTRSMLSGDARHSAGYGYAGQASLRGSLPGSPLAQPARTFGARTLPAHATTPLGASVGLLKPRNVGATPRLESVLERSREEWCTEEEAALRASQHSQHSQRSQRSQARGSPPPPLPRWLTHGEAGEYGEGASNARHHGDGGGDENRLLRSIDSELDEMRHHASGVEAAETISDVAALGLAAVGAGAYGSNTALNGSVLADLPRGARAELALAHVPPAAHAAELTALALDPDATALPPATGRLHLAAELADPLPRTDVRMQLLALRYCAPTPTVDLPDLSRVVGSTRPSAGHSKAVSRVFVAFKLLRFPPVASPVLRLGAGSSRDRDGGAGTGTEAATTAEDESHTLGSVLYQATQDTPAGTPVAAGWQARFVLDASELGETPQALAQRLAHGVVQLHVYDAATHLLLGVGNMALRHFLRGGQRATQTTLRVPLSTLTTAAEVGALYLRLACLGQRGTQRASEGPAPGGALRGISVVLNPSGAQRGAVSGGGLGSGPGSGLAGNTASQPVTRLAEAEAGLSAALLRRHASPDDAEATRKAVRLAALGERNRALGLEGSSSHSNTSKSNRDGSGDIPPLTASLRAGTLEGGGGFTGDNLGLRTSQDLHAVEGYRAQRKHETITALLQQNLTCARALSVPYGATVYLEYVLHNPSQEQLPVVVLSSRPDELAVVTDAAEWRALVASHGCTATAVEEHMFQQQPEGPLLLLAPDERVVVPLKYRLLADDAVGTYPTALGCMPQAAADALAAAAPGHIGPPVPLVRHGRRAHAPRQAEVRFKALTGRTLGVVQLTVTPLPPVVDAAFHFYEAEHALFKKRLRVSATALAQRSDHSGELYAACSDPEAFCTVTRGEDGYGRAVTDVYLKRAVGTCPTVQTLYVMLYSSKFCISPMLTWAVSLHAVERLEMAATYGEISHTVLALRGNTPCSRARCSSSSPSQLRVVPSEEFSIVANALTELLVYARPTTLPAGPGQTAQEAHLLNIVDAALGQLIRTYQVRLTTRYPVITKAFELRVPLDTPSSKRISYSNTFPSERTYYLHSTRPDLVSFKRRTMSIAAGDVGRIGIRVRPSSVIGRHEVIVFVNNEQGQSEEAFKVYISYYAADGDTSWA